MMSSISQNPAMPSGNEHLFKERDLTALFETFCHQAQGRLGPTGQSVFFIGDGLQRALTDATFDALQPKNWSTKNLLRMSTALVDESARLSRLFVAKQARLAWRELANKAEVFALVKNLASILQLHSNDVLSLTDLVEKAYAHSVFEALWAVEGVGHYYAEEHWKREGRPQGLLSEANAPVPAKSLLMLHAGMGLCFADRLIGALTTESTPPEVRDALEQFVKLCKDNSRQGYLGAAIESLGIVTRDFYPDLFKLVTQQLRFVAPEFTGFYWHGIGRAIYFSRKFFIPRLFSMWSDVNEEATDEGARLSIMAGLTWAFALVNMRQPEIVETAVGTFENEPSVEKAFSNGICSCVVMRNDTTPGEPFVSEFCQHRPSTGSRQLVFAWERLISEPVQTGVNMIYPALSRYQALDQVFRFQDLERFIVDLQAQPAGTTPCR